MTHLYLRLDVSNKRTFLLVLTLNVGVSFSFAVVASVIKHKQNEFLCKMSLGSFYSN